jgi:Fic family protein
MTKYIYERTDWPDFRWNHEALTQQLAAVRHRQGRLIGRMQALGFPLREEAVLKTLTEDVLKSSEIEGEILDKDQVRSSIARRLGMDVGALPPADRNVDGVVEMMLDATQRFKEPLTDERLFGWHGALFPTGRSGLSKIKVGAWRDAASGPMQVLSGPYGREKVHYEAPGAERLSQDMAAFLAWYNADDKLDPVIKAALAHLWFVTLHPFDDGNGRIARAIADMSLARSEDVTQWLEWFLACLDRAFDGAEAILANVFRKAEFWKKYAQAPLNKRQLDILNRLLDRFEGKLTSSKYAKIEKCSADTALRDISELVDHGILKKDEGGGRNTSYSLTEIKTND